MIMIYEDIMIHEQIMIGEEIMIYEEIREICTSIKKGCPASKAGIHCLHFSKIRNTNHFIKFKSGVITSPL